MKAFLASVLGALIIAVGAFYALDAGLQRQADRAFVSPTSVRLPSHGLTHNLVGLTWFSAKDHDDPTATWAEGRTGYAPQEAR